MSASHTRSTRRNAAALLIAAVLALGGPAAFAQLKSQERLTAPPPPGAAEATKDDNRIEADEPLPEILYDIAKLPPKVLATLKKILAAARSGDMDTMRAVIEESEIVPAFTFSDDKDPITYWKRIRGTEKAARCWRRS